MGRFRTSQLVLLASLCLLDTSLAVEEHLQVVEDVTIPNANLDFIQKQQYTVQSGEAPTHIEKKFDDGELHKKDLDIVNLPSLLHGHNSSLNGDNGRLLQSGAAVAYLITWAILSDNCNGYNPVLEVACGSGGSIQIVEVLDRLDTNNPSCTTTSSRTARCTSNYDRTPTDQVAMNNAVLVTCSGTQQSQYQIAARSLSHSSLTCTGSNTVASHAVGLSYFNFVAEEFFRDSSCQSVSQTDAGLCFSGVTCASSCSTSLNSVGSTQNLPLPSNAVASGGGGGGGGSSTPNPTPSPGASQPSSSTPSCSPTASAFQFDLLTDRFPQETGWELRRDADNSLVGSLDLTLQPETAYRWSGCLSPTTCYRFTITDSGSDGLCCGFGVGGYFLYFDDVLIHSSGVFGSEEVTRFGGTCGSAGGSTPNPTPRATPNPAPTPTMPPGGGGGNNRPSVIEIPGTPTQAVPNPGNPNGGIGPSSSGYTIKLSLLTIVLHLFGFIIV